MVSQLSAICRRIEQHHFLFMLAAVALSVLAPQKAEAAPWCYRALLAGASGPCVAHTGYAHAGKPFKGWVMLVASGGWDSNPNGTLNYHNGHAEYFRYLGYNTYTVEHTPAYGGGLGEPIGHVSLANVIQHYDDLRAYVNTQPNGSTTPICIWGQSSGGHLSLLTARDRPSINCVVVQEAPTNLETLPSQAQALAARSFGSLRLREYSPIRYYWNEGQHVLIGATWNDAWVGMQQSIDYKNNRPAGYVKVYQHTNGDIPWAHGYVTQSSIDMWWVNVGNFAPYGNTQ
jgi:hypothetical protein